MGNQRHFYLWGLVLACTITLFQNCSGGFQVSDFASGTLPSTSLGNGGQSGSGGGGGFHLNPPLPISLSANPILAAIPENTALDLGAVTCDQPSDGDCNFPIDYSRINYDEVRNQVYAWGGGHGNQLVTSMLAFDVGDASGNFKWKAQTPSTLCADMTSANINPQNASWISTGQPFARHTWDMAMMADVNGVRKWIDLSSGGTDGASAESCLPGAHGRVSFPAGGITNRIMFYDPATGSWTYSSIHPDPYWYYASAAEYDPVSKKVVVTIGNGGTIYDPSADKIVGTFDVHGQINGYSNNLVYFPPTDKFYNIERGGSTVVDEVSLDRATWANTSVKIVSTNGPASDETGWAYDARNQVIGGNIRDGSITLFNPQTGEWLVQTMKVKSAAGVTNVGTLYGSSHAVDFDSKDGVFIFISNGRTWAYRFH